MNSWHECISCPEVRTYITCAKIHSTALRLVWGHMLYCGLRSQTVGIITGAVRSIVATFVAIHSHICCPKPHSVSRRCNVSCLPHLLLLSVEDFFIYCKRKFPGRMSWITLNHVAFIRSDFVTSCTCAQTVLHSVPGHILVIRSFLTSDSLLIIRCIVQHVLLLYALGESVGRWCSMYE
jgi:hypothetical protein